MNEAQAGIDPRWLEWAKRLQAAAQNGLAYNSDPFNIERYQAVRRIATEMMACYTDENGERIAELFAEQIGHATPKVDVRAVVFERERLLMVKERADGLWSLPGGWADVYDSPAEATVREVWEESGYRTRAVKLLAVFDRAKHPHPPFPFHTYKLFLRCELLGGTPTHSIETDDIGWFEEHGLPELSVGRVTAGQITRFFEHLRQPDLPTDFD